MKLRIEHRNVKMNLVFASLISQKLHQLEATLGILKALVTIEQDPASPSVIRISVQLQTDGSRLAAEGLDRDPRTALLKLMRSLQKQIRSLTQAPQPSFSANHSGPLLRGRLHARTPSAQEK